MSHNKAQITESTAPQRACGNYACAPRGIYRRQRRSVRDANHIYYRRCLLLSAVLREFSDHM